MDFAVAINNPKIITMLDSKGTEQKEKGLNEVKEVSEEITPQATKEDTKKPKKEAELEEL